MRPGDAKRVFDLAVGRAAPPLASMVTIFAISFYSSTLVAQFSIAPVSYTHLTLPTILLV